MGGIRESAVVAVPETPRNGVWLEPLSPEWLSKHIVKTKPRALFLWGMNKGYAKRLVNEISFLYKNVTLATLLRLFLTIFKSSPFHVILTHS